MAKHWPKTLKGSYALHGANASEGPAPRVTFQALTSTSLLQRSVGLPTPERSESRVNDESISLLVQDNSPSVEPKETLTFDDKGVSQITWTARVRVKKFALDGPFSVHLFIGEIDDSEPGRFFTKKNEVGYSAIFASPWQAPCGNCKVQREQGLVYEDAIPITPYLNSYLRTTQWPEGHGPDLALRTLESFAPEHVIPFLQKNVGWRVTTAASQLISDPEQLISSGLEVSVSSRRFEYPTAELPLGVYHAAQPHPEITSDKLGGAGYNPTPAS